MKKRFLKGTLALCVAVSNCLAGVQTAGAAPADITAADVTAAIVTDRDSAADVYSTYEVTAAGDASIAVTVTAAGLKAHTNSAGDTGFWTGFAVKAPAGAAQFKYAFSDTAVTDVTSELTPIEIIAEGVEGAAFYTDASLIAPKKYAALEWYDENGTSISEIETFEMDLSGVAIDTDYVPEVTKADLGAVGADEPCASYDISVSEGIVAVTATELKLHDNGEGTPGCWTGFAVKAPAGATQFKYAFSDTAVTGVTSGLTPNEIIAEGAEGAAFYTDAAAASPKKYAALQWFDDTKALTDVVYLEMDLTNVGFNWIKADAVVAAELQDAAGTVTEVCTANEVTAAMNNGEIIAAVKTAGLKSHTNGAGDTGCWTGFAVKAPAEAKSAAYAFAAEEAGLSTTTTITDAEFEEINAAGDKGIAFYTDAGAAAGKRYALLQWFDENGDPLCAATTFVIDLSGTTLDGLNYIPAADVTKANIIDADAPATAPYAAYSITASGTGNIVVNVNNTSLVSHSNGSAPGLWTGFAVKAPAEAVQAGYAFSKDKADLAKLTVIPLETINDGGEQGVSFYADATDKAARYIALQWLDASGNALTNITTFEMNLAGVNPRSTGGGGITSLSSFNIIFNSNGGSRVDSVRVKRNATIEEPAVPTKQGYTFGGWYTDSSCTNEYSFDTKITKSFTLYAKWIENEKTTIVLTIDETEATVNGEAVENDVAPIIVNDRAMLPIRFIAEKLGARVGWEPGTQTVTVTFEDIAIVIVIGEAAAMVNGEEISLDSPAFIENDRTYLPIRFVMEELGADVQWDDEARTVTIVK